MESSWILPVQCLVLLLFVIYCICESKCVIYRMKSGTEMCIFSYTYNKGLKSNFSKVHVHIARSYWIKVHLHFWYFKIMYIQLNWYLKINCKVHICTCWYIFLYNMVKKIQILIYKNKICFVILLYRHFLLC